MMNLAAAGQLAINNSLPRGDRAWPIVEPVQCALVRLLEGNGNPDDVLKVGMALNLTDARLRWVVGGTAGKALIAQAGFILMECEAAGGTSLAEFVPQARQWLIDAVALYVETVRKSSPQQMEMAQRELAKKILGSRRTRRA